jgi:hypothetical protein
MTSIRLQDTVFFTTDFDNCVNELQANHAAFQAPLHVTITPARRFGVPRVRVAVHGPRVTAVQVRTGCGIIRAI